ncbi:uncharacterized protein BYT42DRAFT_241831 [Radiomyces spectabilis]|uniref:uncharacterized protein n=1 Tax=Radiomyces spectabilis TaxID=64574 RepID=UPI00221FE7E4|nr:uncharacterized protein BYT42DRAFT_241831 [Radiomyces spectabilis]KAI8388640.1 hypothetical protein BYT42DRAFT_241831 [Radiomyces spectabilis]
MLELFKISKCTSRICSTKEFTAKSWQENNSENVANDSNLFRIDILTAMRWSKLSWGQVRQETISNAFKVILGPATRVEPVENLPEVEALRPNISEMYGFDAATISLDINFSEEGEPPP